MPASTAPAEKPATERPRPILDIPPVKKLFVHIKNTEDHDALLGLKQVCGEYPGKTDIILVLGAEKKSAIKMPFGVDGSDNLVSALVKQLGEDCVVLK